MSIVLGMVSEASRSAQGGLFLKSKDASTCILESRSANVATHQCALLTAVDVDV
jgi:hypothetical protein